MDPDQTVSSQSEFGFIVCVSMIKSEEHIAAEVKCRSHFQDKILVGLGLNYVFNYCDLK